MKKKLTTAELFARFIRALAPWPPPWPGNVELRMQNAISVTLR